MKNKLFLPAAIFLFSLLLTLPVTATEIQDINAVLDENNQVTVTGKLVPGEVMQVTVKITDPIGNLEYLDQETSDADGNFSFSYTMQTLIDGTYHVVVGGEKIAQPSMIALNTTQPTYTVTFDSNGGSAVTSQEIEHGTVATEPTAPTNEGYSFDSWYSDASLENAYDFGTPVTANITLYAKWIEILTYTVTYNANEATSGSVPADTNQYTQGAKVTVLGNTGNLEKDGYNFAGWNTTPDGSGTKYAAGATFSIGTSDIILYARWTEQPAYTVTFNSNGGSEVPSQNIEHGSTVAEPIAPTREGYRFAGWYTDALLTNAYDFNAPVTADIILHAKWKVMDECFIATASYGSKMAPGVTILRRFRDAKLLTSLPGQAFVSFYYQVSPSIAEYIAGNEALKMLVRTLLLPVIAIVYLVMHPWLLLLAALLVMLYFRRKIAY